MRYPNEFNHPPLLGNIRYGRDLTAITTPKGKIQLSLYSRNLSPPLQCSIQEWNTTAKFIIQACNAHYDLLETLEEITKWSGNVQFGEGGYIYDGALIDINKNAYKQLLEMGRETIRKWRVNNE
jgi:hypothetical protein